MGNFFIGGFDLFQRFSGENVSVELKKIPLASGRNFLFYAKEVWLVICVGNGDQYRFRIKDVKWSRKCLKGLVLKFKCGNHCYSQVVGIIYHVTKRSCSAL